MSVIENENQLKNARGFNRQLTNRWVHGKTSSLVYI